MPRSRQRLCHADWWLGERWQGNCGWKVIAEKVAGERWQGGRSERKVARHMVWGMEGLGKPERAPRREQLYTYGEKGRARVGLAESGVLTPQGRRPRRGRRAKRARRGRRTKRARSNGGQDIFTDENSPEGLLAESRRLVPHFGRLEKPLLDHLLGGAQVDLFPEVVRTKQREVVIGVGVIEGEDQVRERAPRGGLRHRADRRRAEEGADAGRGGEIELEGIIQRLGELLVQARELAGEDLDGSFYDELAHTHLLEERVDPLEVRTLQKFLRRGEGEPVQAQHARGEDEAREHKGRSIARFLV